MIETQIERDMGITHSDFFRTLPQALKAYTWKRQANTPIVTVELLSTNTESSTIIIALSPQKQFALGSLLLPMTHVVFQLKNVVKKTQKEFFQAFDTAYQRGGG